MSDLNEIIRAEIHSAGTMRFDRFMDLALYHLQHGYYTRTEGRSQTGREGDFFTSVSVGPLFGRLLARQFFQMWQLLESPTPFWIIEQGAHDGRLACDILEWCRAEAPEFFAAVRYAIVESPGAARSAQQKNAEKAEIAARITWFDSPILQNVLSVGVFFSNELVDAFPVRVIRCRTQRWHELHVTFDQNAEIPFAWVERPIEDQELVEVVKNLSLPVIEGYTTEIDLRARDWMEDVGRVLKRGYVVTIDYGFPASIYYAPFRVGGTLTAYLNHRRTEEVLIEPGSRDITAHVDFTALAQAGEKAGLTTLGFVDQQRFLMGIAHDELSGTSGPRSGIEGNLRAWNTLTHPEFMGSRFQVLLQSVDAPAGLDGLRFARPGGLDLNTDLFR